MASTSLHYDVLRSLRRLMLVLLLTLTSCVGNDGSRQIGPNEYCENEVFLVACGSDEVVVARSARYGRMRISKCIDRDYGYVGCSSEVLTKMDRLCSGKRKCEVGVPNPYFSSDQCPRDLKPYLEVSYECVKVETPRHRTCSSPQSVPLKAGHGLIASVLTEETGLGSADCPWLVTAPPGQRINLTLHDFGLADAKGDACHAYAIIREREPARSATICNSQERVKQAYISVSNQVEIRILNSKKSDRGRHFLLQYEVVGCPDLPVSQGTWMKRSADGTTALIGCKGSESSWQLKCNNNRWTGKSENCTQVSVGAMQSRLSVIIVVTIALTIGIIFMIIGLACLRWRRKRESERQQKAKKENPYYTGFMPPASKSPDRRHLTRELPWPPPPPSASSAANHDQEALYSSENEYSYIADIPLPPPPPPAAPSSANLGPGAGTHAHNDARELPDPPKYFVLESNGIDGGTRDGVSAPPERYIGVDAPSHSLGGGPRRKHGAAPVPQPEAELFSGHHSATRRSHQGAASHYADFRDFPGRDDRAHNHVSV